MFDTQKAIDAQAKYCKEKHYPHFAPEGDGRCFKCNRNIYEEIDHQNGWKTGVSVEKAGSELITGCPHCHYSFCE